MSTLIVLSSSPPRVFAQSPTPLDSSSPALPSASAILNGDSPGRRKFKTKSTTRDGWIPGFSTARQVLAEKGGAENIPIVSPLRNRFRTRSSQDASEKPEKPNFVKTKQPTLPRTISKESKVLPSKPTKPIVESNEVSERPVVEGPIIIQIAQKHARRTKPKKRAESPLLLPKAATRRTDWTPPKPKPILVKDTSPEIAIKTHPSDLFGSFGYADSNDVATNPHVTAENPTKRRKLDTSDAVRKTLIEAGSVPQLQQARPPKLTSKRSKSPAKKPLTITSLATSKFAGEEVPETTPLMQYLTSSQAPFDGGTEARVFDDKVSKTKAALKKLKEGKKGTRKSLLVSPTSALKSFEEQEAIFGSASQLARDDSPTFLRDTIEAVKQSESSFCVGLTSPLRPTQATSVEASPQMGTLRFRRSRNLWAAAGRDDDNALLHVDTVDLTDTPAVRSAFAGKDVMLQPGYRRSMSPSKHTPLLRGGYMSPSRSISGSFVDIDDIASPNVIPAMQQTSAIHTSAHLASPARPQIEVPEPVDNDLPGKDAVPIEVPNPKKPKKRTPKKPQYTGFTDQELKKQISAYGFKAVKKRDKMIELLERCWEEKHGSGLDQPAEPQPEAEAKGPGYGDILSNVHGVAARPVPKVKKVKTPRKKKDPADEGSALKKPRAPRKKKEPVLDENGVPVKKPRAPRKKKEVDGESTTEPVTKKPAAKRKSKASALSAETVAPEDDDVNDKAGINTKVLSEPAESLEVRLNETATESGDLPAPPKASGELSTTQTTLVSTLSPFDIQDQITKAIMQQSSTIRNQSTKSEPRRNHQKDPTWHERILLYDPIVLEELALWLNTEGLGAVGEDREVSALEVRTWCEGKGICCLWKGGWRGNKAAAD